MRTVTFNSVLKDDKNHVQIHLNNILIHDEQLVFKDLANLEYSVQSLVNYALVLIGQPELTLKEKKSIVEAIDISSIAVEDTESRLFKAYIITEDKPYFVVNLIDANSTQEFLLTKIDYSTMDILSDYDKEIPKIVDNINSALKEQNREPLTSSEFSQLFKTQ